MQDVSDCFNENIKFVKYFNKIKLLEIKMLIQHKMTRAI